jgi:hypothetical protein
MVQFMTDVLVQHGHKYASSVAAMTQVEICNPNNSPTHQTTGASAYAKNAAPASSYDPPCRRTSVYISLIG